MSFFVASAITTGVALAGLYLVRRRYPAEVLKENHEVAAIIFNAFGLFYGVMVAFVVFVTWSGYSDATKNLQMEASEALGYFSHCQHISRPCQSNNTAGIKRLRRSGVQRRGPEDGTGRY